MAEENTTNIENVEEIAKEIAKKVSISFKNLYNIFQVLRVLR